MSDKPIAGLLTAITIAPLCLVCALGPVALVAAGGWFLAWLGGFSVPLIAMVLAVGGWLVWRVVQRRSNLSEASTRESAEIRFKELSGNIE